MDGSRERLLAGLIGGAGAVGSLLLYQALPDLTRYERLAVRFPNALYFLITIFLVGMLGGRLGHAFFLRLNWESLEGRAVVVGAITGTSIALGGWSITLLLRPWLFPLSPLEEAGSLMPIWLVNAVVAGPVIAIAVSLLIARRLRKRSQAHTH